jgi:serine/threonine protein kinase
MAEGEEDIKEDIIVCYSCRAPMNVASVPPYSRVVCPSCSVENRVKKQFGPYILNRRHAIGGMSSVFIATDETLGREVALKILSEEYSQDEKRIAAFEEEARLTASFSHPNVVRVFTTGRAFGRFYIAMELVPGGHFEHQIREKGQIPEKELLPLAIQVAEGLKGAQSAGLIHRDVKPGNILLDAEGNVKIVDFGLALVTQGGKATATEIWATPYYVPPEAIEGGAEDFRADIYAFGATLYHALAGKPPCDEETMATARLREAKKRIVPLKRAAPHLSDETCAVIDRAMAYESIARFGSYDDMIAGLKTALKVANGEVVRDADGATKAERRSELRRKKRNGTIMAVGLGVLVLASVGGLIAMKLSGGSGAPKKPKTKTVEAGSDLGRDRSMEIAAKYRGARVGMERGDMRRAEREFAALLEDDFVQEPTRTWSGLQSIVAAMMDGRMSDARKRASAARDHLNDPSSAKAGSGFQTGVKPVLNGFRDLELFDFETINLSSSGNERFMGYLIAGLRNWEQGGLDQAKPFFQTVASESSLAGDSVLAFHQKTADSYLRDLELLKSSALSVTPETPEECRKATEDLNSTLTLLETNGRARFNIRARQLELAKLERSLSNPSSPRNKGNTLREIEGLAKSYRFPEIVDRLSKLRKDPPGFSRQALLAIAQSAQVFLTEMEADLAKGAVSVPLKLKDGAVVSSLVMSDGKLMGKMADGEVRQLRWTDFPTDQLIELHRELVKLAKSDADRLRRHESAIAFEWLAGDRQRALVAAGRLADENATFKERWEAVEGGLPK